MKGLLLVNRIGYSIFGHDSGDFFYDDAFDFSKTCPVCGFRIDINEHNPSFSFSRRVEADLLYTYDGIAIVSEAFRNFCLKEATESVEFLPFESLPDYFHFIVHEDVRLDVFRSRIQLDDYCNACDRYLSVAGGSPFFLQPTESLSHGFRRTDLALGAGIELSHVILIGEETRRRIETAKLRGIVFREAYV